jgi:hypothetical protein
MPVRALIALLLLCSAAQAADPWTPFRKAFPGKPPPVVAEPLPPLPTPRAPEAESGAAAVIERALLEAELRAATQRAEEAAERAEKAEAAAKEAAVKVEPLDPKSPAMKPKVRAKQRLSTRQPTTPEENDGSWLAPCSWVCRHIRGKSKAELDADEIYWRVTKTQKAHGQRCIVNTCPDAVPADVLREMKQKMRG